MLNKPVALNEIDIKDYVMMIFLNKALLMCSSRVSSMSISCRSAGHIKSQSFWMCLCAVINVELFPYGVSEGLWGL